MISIVIPSYNRKNCILHLLADLRAQREVEFELIVVDDCSPDDTVEVIAKEFPEVILLVNERNSGPCVTRNRGIRSAKGEIIIGFDSDVSVPDRDLLAKVKKAFDGASSKLSGFAFRIYEPDGITDDAPRWWHPLPIDIGRNRVFETSYFSGTGYAFRREAMIGAGLYPEILYMHYEEVELAWHLLDQGGEIHYRPDFSVVHHANPVSRRSEIKVFYKPRNQILLAAGCLPAVAGLRYVLPRMGFQFATACRHGHLPDFLRAMGSVVKLLPARWSNRRVLRPATLGKISSLKKQPGDDQMADGRSISCPES